MNNLTKQEFLQQLDDLKSQAEAAILKQSEIRKATMDFIDENIIVAHVVGVEKRMSYDPEENTLRFIEEATSGSQEDFWRPSSWSDC